MNDIELVYRAGRAQGWTDYPNDSIERGSVWHLDKEKTPFGRICDKNAWMPLNNYADAFCLAADLGICVEYSKDKTEVTVYSVRNPGVILRENINSENKLKVVMRLIVTVAANLWSPD